MELCFGSHLTPLFAHSTFLLGKAWNSLPPENHGLSSLTSLGRSHHHEEGADASASLWTGE